MFATIVMGVVVAVAATVALVGYPSLHVASDSRKSSVPRTTRAEDIAQPVDSGKTVLPARRAPIAASAAAVAPVHVPKAVVEPKPSPVATTRSAAAESVPSQPPVRSAVAVRPSAPEAVASELSKSSSAAASTGTPDVASQSVTISGCLEMTVEEDQFRLTETEGEDAPKGRSWRSGFLRRRSAPVDLVELSDVPALRKLVGQRVEATGVITDRQLRVRSLHASGFSCD